MKFMGWIEENQSLVLPIFLLAYASIVFWSIIAKLGVYGTGDIGHYMATGMLWLNDILPYSELYRPNRGFAVLCALIATGVDSYDALPVVAYISFPSFLIAVFFFFKTFECLADSKTAFFVVLLAVAMPTVNLTVHYPLPEVPLLACYAVALYLTVLRKVSPFVVGVVVGLSFWLRSQILMFIPFWFFLFDDPRNLRSFLKKCFLFCLGWMPFIAAQFAVDGQVGIGGYEHVIERPVYYDLGFLWNHLGRLTVYKVEFLVYAIGVLSVFLKPIRQQFWQLWFFSGVPFVILFSMTVFQGMNGRRPGVYLFMLIPLLFLVYKTVQIVYARVGGNRFTQFAWIIPVVMIAFGLCAGRTSNIIRYVTDPAAVSARMHSYPIDHRGLFQRLPADAIIWVEDYRAYVLTRVNALTSRIMTIDCHPGDVFKVDRAIRKRKEMCEEATIPTTKDPFQMTIDSINDYPEPLDATAFAAWRRGDPEGYRFPSEFVDVHGNIYTLLGEEKAHRQAFALYSVNRSAKK